MKIASYNIRKCIGLDRKRNPNRILSVINDMSVDIIVLQEADKRFGQRPSSLPFDQIVHQTGMTPVDLGHSGPSLGWHGNCVLAKPGTTISNIECLKLPGLEPRGAIVVDVSVSQTVPFCLVAVHLGLLRKSRTRQLAYIQDVLKSRAPQSTIIVGDFNEWSQMKGLDRLAQDFNIVAPGNSFHASRPVAKLDRFALSKNLYVKDAGVMEKGQARRASDHLPIWAEIAHKHTPNL